MNKEALQYALDFYSHRDAMPVKECVTTANLFICTTPRLTDRNKIYVDQILGIVIMTIAVVMLFCFYIPSRNQSGRTKIGIVIIFSVFFLLGLSYFGYYTMEQYAGYSNVGK